MFNFNQENFKAALKKSQEEDHKLLMIDIVQVKAFVEKMLSLGLNCTASMSRAEYPGLEI